MCLGGNRSQILKFKPCYILSSICYIRINCISCKFEMFFKIVLYFRGIFFFADKIEMGQSTAVMLKLIIHLSKRKYIFKCLCWLILCYMCSEERKCVDSFDSFEDSQCITLSLTCSHYVAYESLFSFNGRCPRDFIVRYQCFF